MCNRRFQHRRLPKLAFNVTHCLDLNEIHALTVNVQFSGLSCKNKCIYGCDSCILYILFVEQSTLTINHGEEGDLKQNCMKKLKLLHTIKVQVNVINKICEKIFKINKTSKAKGHWVG